MTAGGFGKCYLNDVFNCSIDGLVVHIDNLVTFFAIGFFDGILNGSNGFFLGDDTGDEEESSLHDHVDARTKPKSLTKGKCIDDVEFCFFIDQIFLNTAWQFFPDLFGIKSGGEEEGSALIKIAKHVVLIKEGEVMTCNEVGLINKVRSNNPVFTKSQVRGGDGSRFF